MSNNETRVENHRVTLDWLFDRNNLDLKIQMKYVDTKNQIADMLTKGSLTHDAWDHLLRLLNIMNFSMFSCSHFFFSNRQQSAMAKRAQESTSKEGSAMAKSRPVNLVSRNLLSARMDLPQDVSDSNSPVNSELEHGGVSSRGRKLKQNTNQNPTMYCQERQQDDTQSSSTRKLGRRDEPSDSARARRLERGEDTQVGRSKMELHNMQISNYRYLEKVFKNLQKK